VVAHRQGHVPHHRRKARRRRLRPAGGRRRRDQGRPDLDAIEALSIEREALWARLEKATFLTPDEKRAAVGYGFVGWVERRRRPNTSANR
jgi:phage portal protein BeeE